VILDDALQHRALIPDCAIVLTTYQAPFHSDHLLPVGYLRDLKGRVKCAHIIVVTKCPNLISPHEHNVWRQKLKLLPHQILFFSRIVYGQIATFDGLQPIKHGDSVQLVSGIADDALFVAHVSSTYVVKKHWKYPDHKIFELKDINDWVKNESGQHIAVLTTEKDAVRLKSMKLPVNMTIYYVPITIEFIGENEGQRFIMGVQTLLN
jgi:tetraacyldisaccharide 4'-kinase